MVVNIVIFKFRVSKVPVFLQIVACRTEQHFVPPRYKTLILDCPEFPSNLIACIVSVLIEDFFPCF